MSLACLHSDRLERTTRQIVREYWWTSQRVSVDILRSVSRSPSVSPRPAPALLFLLLLRRASSLALHSLSQTSFSLSLHLSPLPVSILISVSRSLFPEPRSNGIPPTPSQSPSRSVPLLLVSRAPFHSRCEDAHSSQTLRRPTFQSTSPDPDTVCSNIRVLVLVLVFVIILLICPYRIALSRSRIWKYYRVMVCS
jgi:hypothetical protein